MKLSVLSFAVLISLPMLSHAELASKISTQNQPKLATSLATRTAATVVVTFICLGIF